MCRYLVKFILFFVNLIFMLIGLAVIGVGIAVIYHIDQLSQEIPIISLDYVPYGLISLGVLVFLIASSGCFGAVTENKCPLITYAVFMGFFATLKIVLVIMLFVNLPAYTGKVQTAVNNTFEEPAHNITFHGLEVMFQCCGTTGPDSYETGYDLVPPTCCENPTNHTVCPKEEAFQTGCTTMVGEYFNLYAKSFGYGFIGAVVWELVAMSFSIYIFQTRKAKKSIDANTYY